MPEQQSLMVAEPEGELAPKQQDGLMSIIQMAVAQNASIETIRELWALHKDVKAEHARESYNAAFAAFKAESVRIVRNATVNDGPLKGKKYADLFAVVDAITPALSQHGLSSSWKLTRDEPQWMEVSCTLRHVAGHSETVLMGGPPDTGGAKNAIQARASTKNYLERYTLLAITGLAPAGQDNDGNGGGGHIDDIGERLEFIKNARSRDELKTLYENHYKVAERVGDKKAMTAIIRAKDERKKELAA